MPDEVGDIWRQVLSAVESEIAKTGFDSWLRGTRPLGVLDNTIFVAVPSSFAAQHIEARYLNLIRATLSGIVGSEMQVRLVVSPSDSEVAAGVDATPQVPAEVGAGLPNQALGLSGSAPVPMRQVAPSSSARDPFTAIVPFRKSPAATLNPKYTFDSFVVGNANRFAHAGALAVADSPGKAYNPLFIYGGTGLGKTHLMQAIGHQAARTFPDLAILYVTSETFTNELINAIRDDRTMEFKNRYRNNDLLLVDDVQFIGGKDRTQEEFFHTYEALTGASHQIVLTSDRPPKEIHLLEERLRSRFEGGLLADVQPPDLETRAAILRKKAQLESLPVPDEVIMHVANLVNTNIRELEGALIRIVASASLENRLVTLEMAEKALHDILPRRVARPATMADIQRAVTRYYALTVEDLKSENRARKVSLPRQVAMYLCRELTGASLPRIGQEFGGRDHTTILHGCEKIGAERKTNPELEQILRMLRTEIQDSQTQT